MNKSFRVPAFIFIFYFWLVGWFCCCLLFLFSLLLFCFCLFVSSLVAFRVLTLLELDSQVSVCFVDDEWDCCVHAERLVCLFNGEYPVPQGMCQSGETSSSSAGAQCLGDCLKKPLFLVTTRFPRLAEITDPCLETTVRETGSKGTADCLMVVPLSNSVSPT